jgi:hypothetical protein
VKGPTTRAPTGYTAVMEAALVVLVIVVTAVAIDTITSLSGRLRERRQRRDVASATPERIIVDLSDRDGGSEDDR